MVAYSHDEIDQLIIQAQAGDRGAIAIIYEQFVDRVYRFVASRIREQDDAEDVTAEVFVELLKRPRYDQTGEEAFLKWLYQIAQEQIKQYEARHPQHKRTDSVLEMMLSQSPEKMMLEREQVIQLREAMQALSQDEYTILILRFVEGKSHEDVAEIMNKSTAATRVMQFRALKNLAKALNLEKKRHYLRPAQSADD
ncbi:MAG: RNA polymerase sigma factor [Anaerolineae bacterium]